MKTQAFFALVTILLAFVAYTVGVWSERCAGRLKPWHLTAFWIGLIFDTVGTKTMMNMAGGLTADLHGVTGVAAILLMLVHAVWATWVLVRKDEAMTVKFHRFSVVVWAIWLVPFLSPALVPMA